MRFRFYLKEGKFFIEKTWGPAWVFFLLGFLGFVAFGAGALVAAVFFIGNEPDAIAGGFGIFVCLLGMAFIWAGFASPAKNYGETITIDKVRSTIEFLISKQSARQIRAKLSELQGIFWIEGYAESFDRSASSRRKEYILYFVFRDQSSIYIAREHNKPGRLEALLAALQEYLGENLPQLTEEQLWEKPKTDRPSLQLQNPYPVQFFERNFQKAKELLGIAKPKRNFVQKAVFFLIALVFLSAPLLLASQILSPGGIGSLIAGGFLFVFCIFWYGVLALIFLYNARKISFVRHSQGFQLRLRFPMLSFLDREMDIPNKSLDFLAIHRGKEGHWFLCAHLREPLSLQMGFLLGQSLSSGRPAVAYSTKNTRKLLTLAHAAGWTKPGKGALLEDLRALKKELE